MLIEGQPHPTTWAPPPPLTHPAPASSVEAPLEAPLGAEPTAPWDPAAYVLRSQDQSPLGATTHSDYFEMPKHSLSPAACGCEEPVLLPEDPMERRRGSSSMFVLPIPIQYQSGEASFPEPENVGCVRFGWLTGRLAGWLADWLGRAKGDGSVTGWRAGGGAGQGTGSWVELVACLHHGHAC